MRLLVISAAFPPMRAGEAEHTLHLCERLTACGLDVRLLTTRTKGLKQDVPFTLLPVMRKWSWSEVPDLMRCVKTCAPDAALLTYIGWIYNHHPMITFSPTLVRAIRPGIPFVTQFLNPIGAPSPQPTLLTRASRKLAAFWAGGRDVDYKFGTLLRDSSHVIVLSERHRATLTRRSPGITGKSLMIPPPPILRIHPDHNGAARQKGRDRLGVTSDEILLAYFGFIYPGKGIETLLKAMQIVARSSPQVRLILVGGIIALEFSDRPSYAEELRELSQRLGIENRVSWVGEYGSDDDSASLYLRAADICVLPFDHGINLNNSSVAAAVTHGLPVVTTRGPVVEEPFRHAENVFLCPPQSPEAMAGAIALLIDQPELRQRLRAGASQLAQEWFSWDNAIKRTLAALASPGESRTAR